MMEERELELVYWTAHGVFRARFYWEATDICIVEIHPRWFDCDKWRGVVMVMAEGYENYRVRYPSSGVSLS